MLTTPLSLSFSREIAFFLGAKRQRAQTYQVFKKIQKEPATCSQAWMPPFGGGGKEEAWVLGGDCNGTGPWSPCTIESLSLVLVQVNHSSLRVLSGCLVEGLTQLV